MYSRHQIRLIGVPFGLGGRAQGAGLGPAAIRLAGIETRLAQLVETVVDAGDVVPPLGSVPLDRGGGIGYFEQVFANHAALREAVADAISARSIPLVLGGDHSLAVATVSAALEETAEGVGVLWIDAHGDYNTPDTSPSGNLHGMPLALLAGFGCEAAGEAQRQWNRLRDAMIPNESLNPENIVWLGVRDPDPGETARILRHNPQRCITMTEVDRFGIPAMLELAVSTLKAAGVTRLWVSFDVDVLDPFIAPGTGTDVRGGFSYREAHLVAEMLHETLADSSCPFELIGVEVVETNPILDRSNETAKMAVEWTCSLFGKRIMPPWPTERHDVGRPAN